MLESAFIAVDVTVALLILLFNLNGAKYYKEYKIYKKSKVVQGRIYKCTGYKMAYNGFGYNYYSECEVTFTVDNRYYDIEKLPVVDIPKDRVVDIHYEITSKGIEVMSGLKYYRFRTFYISAIASSLMVAIAFMAYWL